jgi:uncharacterized membrane protein
MFGMIFDGRNAHLSDGVQRALAGNPVISATTRGPPRRPACGAAVRKEGADVETFRVVALIAATIAMGLMAGVFALYSNTIMPGLGRAGDRTFVGGFQALDKAIENPLFLIVGFLGALVLTGLAGLLHLSGDWRSVLPWLIAAFVLYLVAFVTTIGVHLPLNDIIKAAGDPDRITDLAAVRERFNEARWVAWNLVRVVASLAAFGCLTWALVLHGRVTGTS